MFAGIPIVSGGFRGFGGAARDRYGPPETAGWLTRQSNEPSNIGPGYLANRPAHCEAVTSRGRCPCEGEGWSASAIARPTERGSSTPQPATVPMWLVCSASGRAGGPQGRYVPTPAGRLPHRADPTAAAGAAPGRTKRSRAQRRRLLLPVHGKQAPCFTSGAGAGAAVVAAAPRASQGSGTTQVVGQPAHERAQDHAPARRRVGEPRPVEPAGALRMLVEVGSLRGAAGSC